MAIGSGLGSSFGVVDETVYGTLPGSPTWRWYDPKDKQPDLKGVKNTAQGGGLFAGRFAPPASRRVVTTRAGAIGSLPLEVTNSKMGYLLKHIFGGLISPVQQSTSTAYLQTHAIADNVGRSFCAQVQVPATDGTVKPFTGRGGKITSAEFSCELDGLLMVDIAADFQQVLDTDGAGAPSATPNLWPFSFGQMNVKLGATYGAESSVNGVRKASAKIERGQAVDRFYAGAGGLKAEPLMNDWVKVTGSMDVDLVNKADFADRFRDDTQTSVVLEWVGAVPIATGFYPTFRLKVPAVFFDDGTPTVDGAGVVSNTYNWTADFDLTNALVTCEYLTPDTTL